VQVGHDLQHLAEAPVERRELSPAAVDLGAQPIGFLLERLRFGLEP